MTRIRKLALRISEFVVRHASPGCKEWAEGLSRETAAIESDWSALSWALGSIRIVLHRREAPLRSLDKISSVTWSFIESQRFAGMVGWLYMLLFGLQYAFSFITAKNGEAYTGSALVVFSMLSLGICSFVEQRRLDALRTTDSRDDVLIYKSELERSRDLPRSPRGRLILIAVLILLVGALLAQHGRATVDPSACYFFLTMSLIFSKRRANRRRLEQLEALLAEKS